MKKLFLFAAIFMQAGGQPVSIPIENPSFESYAGWKFESGGRIENGVALAGYGSSFSQTLSTTPSALQEYRPGYTIDGFYVLKFSVANYFPSYPGYYAAKVSFGTQELCETSGWGTRASTQITLVCPSPGYLIVDKALPAGGPVQGQQNLAISFSAPGWTVLFDNVSMTWTPQ